jgi:hypothetical protein
MDTQTAQALLQRIHQVKQAELELPPSRLGENLSRLADIYPKIRTNVGKYLPNVGKYLPTLQGGNSATAATQQHLNAKLRTDVNKNIIRALMLGAGGGAAIRGAAGLSNMMSEPSRIPSTQRVVDMPVSYPVEKEKSKEKRADNDKATSSIGLDYYIPSMILGTSAATYGGWKGIDALLDRQRHKQTNEELEDAKQEYEKSLLGAYKKATDAALDRAFAPYDKSAGFVGTVKDTFNSVFPNVSGAAKGLGLTYLLSAGPAGYMVVDDMMKKNSKRALLHKAMQERARRQAMVQPPEIYATPQPQEEESE